jgi:hypothetical protein
MRKRLLLILAVGLFLAQATLAASFMQCRMCASGTTDDDCQPRCETCLCCSMARAVVPAEPGVRSLSVVGSVVAPTTVPRRPADPQDIFHVPKLALS